MTWLPEPAVLVAYGASAAKGVVTFRRYLTKPLSGSVEPLAVQVILAPVAKLAGVQVSDGADGDLLVRVISAILRHDDI